MTDLQHYVEEKGYTILPQRENTQLHHAFKLLSDKQTIWLVDFSSDGKKIGQHKKQLVDLEFIVKQMKKEKLLMILNSVIGTLEDAHTNSEHQELVEDRVTEAITDLQFIVKELNNAK